jgi:dolichol-phosphate mannosyltransferase
MNLPLSERALVILPTYNEVENLPTIVEAVLELGEIYHVLIIDDNSPDGTGRVADALAQRHQDRVQVIHRSGKLGLGTAYIQGFRHALAKGYGFAFEMDADGSHNPSDLPRLLEAAQGAHLALGSRYMPGGGIKDWPAHRLLLSRLGALYSRLLLGLPVSDPTGGFKCFRAEALRALDLDAIRSNGYAFQIEVTYRLYRKGYKIVEVPITFVERRSGSSKLGSGIVLEALLMVPRLRLMRL